jgi:hypothetical protein
MCLDRRLAIVMKTVKVLVYLTLSSTIMTIMMTTREGESRNNDDDGDDNNNSNNNNNNNNPDIIIRDKEKGTYMLIDVAIPGDRNVIKKEADKILKYKDLIIEIQRMWNVKAKVKPIIIAATGTISKSFRKYLISVPGKQGIKELQKTAILGTAHTLREVLM